jgi:hypothetical protein
MIEWVLIAKLTAISGNVPGLPIEIPIWAYQTRGECEVIKREGYYSVGRAEVLYGGDGVREQFFCRKRLKPTALGGTT